MAREAEHQLYIDRQPEMGVPLSMRVRFQVNLLLEQDSNFPPISTLNSGRVALPVFWAEEGIDGPAPSDLDKLYLVLKLPAWSGLVLASILAFLALIFRCVPLVCCLKTRT